MKSGTPQVGPARFDGVRSCVFGALFSAWRQRARVVAPKKRDLTPSTAQAGYAAGFFLGEAFVILPERMHRVQA